MHGDRLLFLKTIVKVVALQQLRDGVFLRQSDEIDRAEFRKPAAVEIDHRLFWIKNLEDLLFICLSIAIDLFARKRLARRRTSAGIAD